jgi:sugar lactone lactonase YvrE
MTVRIERIGPTRDLLGESPLWDHRVGALYWVDSRRGRLARFDPARGRLKTWDLPAEIGSVGLAPGGRLLVALRNGFWAFDPDSAELKHIATVFDDTGRFRLNDGKADRQGRFLCGTLSLAHPAESVGGLFRLGPGRRVETLETGLRIANATCFSPDGRRMYFTDSLDLNLRAYDYDPATGAVSNRRVLLDARPHGSGVDGATVDAEGFIWAALVQNGRLARFAPDGSLDRMIELDIPFPTCPAFGGPGLDVLYLTSISDSGTGRATSTDPRAGGLFAVRNLGVRGLPEAVCPL